jgi:hypothetical protein
MLRMLLTEHATVPWQALVYLTAEITYGGRVTDMWDKRCLVNIVEKFCSSDCLEEGFSYTSSKVGLNKPYHSIIPYYIIIPCSSSLPYHHTIPYYLSSYHGYHHYHTFIPYHTISYHIIPYHTIMPYYISSYHGFWFAHEHAPIHTKIQ